MLHMWVTGDLLVLFKIELFSMLNRILYGAKILVLKYWIITVVEPPREQAWMVGTRADPACFLLGIQRSVLACHLSWVGVFLIRKNH